MKSFKQTFTWLSSLLLVVVFAMSGQAYAANEYMTAPELRQAVADKGSALIGILGVTTTGDKYITGSTQTNRASADGTLAGVRAPEESEVLEVLPTTGGYYLRQHTAEAGQGYLACSSGGNFSVVAETSASVWTILGPDETGYGSISGYDDIYPDIAKASNELMVRFISSGQYMNGQAFGQTGGLRGGTGAWSFNYVVKVGGEEPADELPAIDGNYVRSLGGRTTEISTTQWYVLTNARDSETPTKDNGVGEVINREQTTTAAEILTINKPATDVANYLVRFIPSGVGNSYKVQFGNGNYFNTKDKAVPAKNVQIVTNASEGVNFLIVPEANGMAFKSTEDGLTSTGFALDNSNIKEGAVHLLSYWTEGTYSNNGNNIWFLYPVEIGEYVNTATVTYNYWYGSEQVGTKTSTQKIGDPIAAPEQIHVFTGNKYDESIVVEEGGTTVDITVYDATPFEAAPSYEEIEHWYALKIKNQLWLYNTGDAAITGTSAYEISDKYVWGFVGNIFDGYVIYNKEAGKTVALGNDIPSTLNADGTSVVWTIPRVGTLGDQSFGLKTEGQDPVNLQSNTLKRWSGFDAGSTFTVEEVVIGESTFTVHINGAPEGTKVTINGNEYGEGETVTMDAATATVVPATVSLYNVSVAYNGTNLNVNYVACGVKTLTELVQGQAYTITSGGTRGAFVYNNEKLTSTYKAGVTADATDANQQFLFVQHDSKYYLYSVGADKFISLAEDGGSTVLTDEPVDTDIQFLENQHSLKQTNPVVLQMDEHHLGISNGYDPAVITTWKSTNDEGNSLRIWPVDATIDMNAILAKFEEEPVSYTEGDFYVKNEASGKYFGFVGTSTSDGNFGPVEEADKLVCTVSQPEEGTFNIQLFGFNYVSCGSNGGFSNNKTANALQLFKVNGSSAVKATTIEEGAEYLIVGNKNGTDYALSNGTNGKTGADLRTAGISVTITDNTISTVFGACKWTFEHYVNTDTREALSAVYIKNGEGKFFGIGGEGDDINILDEGQTWNITPVTADLNGYILENAEIDATKRFVNTGSHGYTSKSEDYNAKNVYFYELTDAATGTCTLVAQPELGKTYAMVIKNVNDSYAGYYAIYSGLALNKIDRGDVIALGTEMPATVTITEALSSSNGAITPAKALWTLTDTAEEPVGPIEPIFVEGTPITAIEEFTDGATVYLQDAKFSKYIVNATTVADAADVNCYITLEQVADNNFRLKLSNGKYLSYNPETIANDVAAYDEEDQTKATVYTVVAQGTYWRFQFAFAENATAEQTYNIVGGVAPITTWNKPDGAVRRNFTVYKVASEEPVGPIEPEFPLTGQPYLIKEKTSGMYLNVIPDSEDNKKDVVLKKKGQDLYFTAVEGGYTITTAEGLYVGGFSNGWNMSSLVAQTWVVEEVEGGYALRTADVGKYLGFDNVENEGAAAFRDKDYAANYGIFEFELNVFPAEGKAYQFKEKDSGMFLNVIPDSPDNKKDVVLKKTAQALYFTAVEGGYTIATEDGLYVGASPANGWNMSSLNPQTWVVEEVEGGYALRTADVGKYLGFDNVDNEGAAAYRDKDYTANHGIFEITAYGTAELTAKDKLAAAIAEAKALSTEGVPTDLVEELQNAIEMAEGVLGDDLATDDDYAEAQGIIEHAANAVKNYVPQTAAEMYADLQAALEQAAAILTANQVEGQLNETTYEYEITSTIAGKVGYKPLDEVFNVGEAVAVINWLTNLAGEDAETLEALLNEQDESIRMYTAELVDLIAAYNAADCVLPEKGKTYIIRSAPDQYSWTFLHNEGTLATAQWSAVKEDLTADYAWTCTGLEDYNIVNADLEVENLGQRVRFTSLAHPELYLCWKNVTDNAKAGNSYWQISGKNAPQYGAMSLQAFDGSNHYKYLTLQVGAGGAGEVGSMNHGDNWSWVTNSAYSSWYVFEEVDPNIFSDITGVGTVLAPAENGLRFNLQGQRIDSNVRGINIVNGKKIIRK